MLVLVAILGLGACRQGGTGIWFKGDFDAALALAKNRQTLVLLEFYTDWCNWCRRLESDTFNVAEVQRELAGLVAVKQNAEKEGAALAARFGVDSFPTLIFLDPDGNEVDRILGYLPPDKFLHRMKKIRTGDTFLACLRTLQEDPGDIEAIKRSVEGLLSRSDPEGAISRINAFHQATEGRELDLCRRLMFEARVELHTRVYQRAARLYLRGWDRAFDVPDTTGTEELHVLVSEGLPDWPADEQADRLRAARHQDASNLLELPDLESTSPKGLLEVASFAFSNGHFDVAADLYLRWYESEGSGASSGLLNDVAWRLYLGGTELQAASEIARHAYEKKKTSENTDTLARLLYVTGAVDEAIALERNAAENADGPESEAYRGIAEKMEAGEKLDDRPPPGDNPDKAEKMNPV
jgi:thioredoxin-related protein